MRAKPSPLFFLVMILLLAACQAEYEADAPLVDLRLQMDAEETAAPESARISYTVGYQLRTQRRCPRQLQTVNSNRWQLQRRLRTGDTLLLWALSPQPAGLLPDSIQNLQGEAADSAALALGLDQVRLPLRLSVSLEGQRIAADSTAQLNDSIRILITVPEP